MVLASCTVRYNNIDNWQAFETPSRTKQQAFDQCKAKALDEVPGADFGSGGQDVKQLRIIMRRCMIVNGYKYTG